jgi:Kef-type K+ transport system membrane component KefB
MEQLINILHSNYLLLLGMVILAGYFASLIVNKFKLPGVTGYIIIGVILGNSVLKILTPKVQSDFSILNDIALGIIAFTIGLELSPQKLSKIGKSVLWIAAGESVGAFLLVTLASYLYLKKVYMALIFGAIASATAPAATVMVINETGARGVLTSTILAIVAIDDSFSLMIYSFASVLAKSLLGGGKITFHLAVVKPVEEITIAIIIGIVIGAFFWGFLKFFKIKSSVELLTFFLGGILICDGIASSFEVSELLANMSFGIFISSFFPYLVNRLNSTFSNFGPPIYLAFFVIAGSKLNLFAFKAVGILCLIYFLSRAIGKVVGASIGAIISNAEEKVKKYVGLGLIPQVGVAVALSLVVAREFKKFGQPGIDLSSDVINILLFTTIITEILGPFLTKWALERAGEIKK